MSCCDISCNLNSRGLAEALHIDSKYNLVILAAEYGSILTTIWPNRYYIIFYCIFRLNFCQNIFLPPNVFAMLQYSQRVQSPIHTNSCFQSDYVVMYNIASTEQGIGNENNCSFRNKSNGQKGVFTIFFVWVDNPLPLSWQLVSGRRLVTVHSTLPITSTNYPSEKEKKGGGNTIILCNSFLDKQILEKPLRSMHRFLR